MTKSTLLKFYSIVKIVKAKELPKLFKVYKDNPKRLLVMFKKRPKKPDPFTLIFNELSKINKRLDRFDAIVKVNNLIDPTKKTLLIKK